jgi:hypothetical protein
MSLVILIVALNAFLRVPMPTRPNTGRRTVRAAGAGQVGGATLPWIVDVPSYMPLFSKSLLSSRRISEGAAHISVLTNRAASTKYCYRW